MCKKVWFMIGAGMGAVAGMYIVAKNNQAKKMVIEGEEKVKQAISDMAPKKPKSKPKKETVNKKTSA